MSDVKQNLLSLQQELNARVAGIEADLHSRHTSSKFSDQVVDRQNDDVLQNLKSEAEDELTQIEHALLKIERGLYGHCDTCHEKIAQERIEAVPFTPYCKNCAL
jgi:RNA polymerase-binding transcription factor DksA